MTTAVKEARPKRAEGQSSLRRTLGRWTATFLTGAMIIGTGLLAALGATAEIAGSGLLFSILLSGLIALSTARSITLRWMKPVLGAETR